MKLCSFAVVGLWDGFPRWRRQGVDYGRNSLLPIGDPYGIPF
jgi:hypothetical protein